MSLNRFMFLAFALALFSISAAGNEKKLQVCAPRCAQQLTPSCIDTPRPDFAWQLKCSAPGTMQSAYRIVVAATREDLRKKRSLLWDSGQRASQESLHTPYAGRPLAPFHTYYWQVKVWDQAGNESDWSEPQELRTGPFGQADWQPARWIAMDTLAASYLTYPSYQAPSTNGTPAYQEPKMPQFRKAFRIDKKVRSAYIHVSGLGHCTISINGRPASENFLDPAWTRYDQKAFYVTYNITPLLRKGENVVGARLGSGFLCIPRTNERYHKLISTFSAPKMIAKIRIDYADGSTDEVVTDPSWQVSPSPVTFSSIYGGEDYDATQDSKGWDKAGFDASAWANAIEVSPVERLEAQPSCPMKVMQRFAPRQILEPAPGIFIYDMGQNASGIVQLTVSGKRGSRIILRPGEFLNADSLPDQSNSGQPYYFSYTLAGEKSETWAPSFTYYGFRYVQVEGAVPAGHDNPGRLSVVEDLQMLHVSNSAEAVGTFSCSDTLFNRIYSLIDWAMKSNMAHVLTDCPHREKLGWLEVTHLMSQSLAYCYDMSGLFRKVLADMRDSQLPNGLVPSVAPEFTAFDGDFRDSPEWGSASVLLPWFLYEWYGDSSAVRDNFEMMRSYVAYLDSRSEQNLLFHGLGDWYDLGPAHPGYSQLTTRGLTPTAFFYLDLRTLAQAARLLGQDSLAQGYDSRAEEVKKAFNQKFFNAEKNYYDQGSQTANAIAICTGLADDSRREASLRQLIADIRARDNSITAGDIGFHFLVEALSEGGASDVLYDMNSQSDKPGYGYQIEQGATALTESWAALKTASHNHCMLGHLMEWFYKGLGGIRRIPGNTAFRRFLLCPEPVGRITSADVTFRSPYGLIESRWEIKDGRFDYQVTVPPGTRATVCLPTDKAADIEESGKPIDTRSGIRPTEQVEGRCAYEIGSGHYEFSFPYATQAHP